MGFTFCVSLHKLSGEIILICAHCLQKHVFIYVNVYYIIILKLCRSKAGKWKEVIPNIMEDDLSLIESLCHCVNYFVYVKVQGQRSFLLFDEWASDLSTFLSSSSTVVPYYDDTPSLLTELTNIYVTL